MSVTFDRYAGIVFLLVGVLFIVESTGIDSTSYGSAVGPNIFPLGLGILLVVTSGFLIWDTFKKKVNLSEEQEVDEEDEEVSKYNYKRFLIILAATIMYAMFLEPLGYVITTFLFLIIGFQTLKKGNVIKTIVIAAFFSYGLYYVYVELLSGALPGFPSWTGL